MQTYDPDQSFLLQLPEPVLSLVLQNLKQHDLACLAVACSRLSRSAPANNTSLSVRRCSQATLLKLVRWLDEHGASITQSRIYAQYSGDINDEREHLCYLPWPRLIELRLKSLRLRLEPAGDHPGVLHDCTSLKVLDLQGCGVEDADGAFAAIAALPGLRSLTLADVCDTARVGVMGDLKHLTQLTRFCLVRRLNEVIISDREPVQLRQLSAMVNLEDLELRDLGVEGLPGGLPFQLTKLTRLHLVYSLLGMCNPAEQMQHLSILTALQDLTVGSIDLDNSMSASDLSGIGCLQLLTRLSLSCCDMQFSIASTRSWAAKLPTLEALSLSRCTVQPDALSALTQLRALSLQDMLTDGCGELLLAVSDLPHLTQLCIAVYTGDAHPGARAACTALTLGTSLCSLHLALEHTVYPHGCDLFRPGAVYPHLRHINLWAPSHLISQYRGGSATHLVEQQLQQLCCCCPALVSLSFAPRQGFSREAFTPLLQLSALTFLEVWDLGAAAGAAVDVAAQLIGLKQLALRGLPELINPVLVHLTALTAMEDLTLATTLTGGSNFTETTWSLSNEARWNSSPDVWMQLLRGLLRHAEAVMKSSTSNSLAGRGRRGRHGRYGIRGPVESILVQLPSALAEELATSLSLK